MRLASNGMTFKLFGDYSVDLKRLPMPNSIGISYDTISCDW